MGTNVDLDSTIWRSEVTEAPQTVSELNLFFFNVFLMTVSVSTSVNWPTRCCQNILLDKQSVVVVRPRYPSSPPATLLHSSPWRSFSISLRSFKCSHCYAVQALRPNKTGFILGEGAGVCERNQWVKGLHSRLAWHLNGINQSAAVYLKLHLQRVYSQTWSWADRMNAKRKNKKKSHRQTHTKLSVYEVCPQEQEVYQPITSLYSSVLWKVVTHTFHHVERIFLKVYTHI